MALFPVASFAASNVVWFRLWEAVLIAAAALAAYGPVARPLQAPDVGGWPGGDVRRGLDSVRD